MPATYNGQSALAGGVTPAQLDALIDVLDTPTVDLTKVVSGGKLVISAVAAPPTTATVVETAATGTVDTTIDGVTGNAVLAINEQATAAAPPASTDLMTFLIAGKHVAVTVQQLAAALATILPAEKFLDGASYDPATGALTLTVANGAPVTVDLADLIKVTTDLSVTGNGTTTSPVTLVNDLAAPGPSMVYSTDLTGTKGWHSTDLPIRTTSSATTLDTATDYTLLVKPAGAAVPVALATPAAGTRIRCEIKMIDTTGSVVITPASGTIDGAASYTIDNPMAAIGLRFDGTNWWVF